MNKKPTRYHQECDAYWRVHLSILYQTESMLEREFAH